MLKLPVQRRDRKTVQSSFRERAPYGVTIVEVVLVLSVIFLNVAIFLPLVNSARESSRRTQCRDNLKQIGMAIWQYEESHKSFPAGFEVSSSGKYLGWGWSTRILPHLNAPSNWQSIEPYRAKGIYGWPRSTEFRQPMPSFSCPSDVGEEMVPHAFVVSENVVDGVVSPGTENWARRLPRSNYFGSVGYLQVEVGGIQYNAAGTPTSLAPLANAGSLGNTGPLRSAEHRYCDQKYFGGYFGQNSRVKVTEVHDGTSNTIMIGERYSPADSSLNAVGYGTWIGVPDCTRAQGLAMSLADASVRINIGMPLREQTTGFGSLHGDGAFFALGDGSVRFITREIDIVLFRNLSVISEYTTESLLKKK